MRRFILLGLALVALASAGCQKTIKEAKASNASQAVRSACFSG